jgi:hypothetical protein
MEGKQGPDQIMVLNVHEGRPLTRKDYLKAIQMMKNKSKYSLKHEGSKLRQVYRIFT